MSRLPLLLLAAAVSPLAFCAPATPPAPATAPATRPDSSRFLRFVETGNDSGRLEAAIRSYRNDKTGVAVHLVSAVHVADKPYFDRLNRFFRSCDAVLYEMVKPRNAPPPPPGFRSGSSVSGLQRFLKDNLDLEFQLDAIDYTQPNFVHADLDAETFERLMAERGESLTSLMMRAMLSDMTAPQDPNNPPPTIFDLLKALAAPDRPRQLKLLLAKQFNDVEDKLAGLSGPNGSVLLTERNKAALTALRAAMLQSRRNIAIFYGAGHMQDLESHLLRDLHFRPTDTQWFTAWDLPPAPATRPATRAATAPSH